MFSGIYSHQLDDKGRLRLPAKLRAELGKSFVLMKGIDDSITIYPLTAFDAMCEKFMTYDPTDVEVQRAITELMSYSFPIEEDSQGRFVIPQIMKTFAGIDKNVVVKGVLNKIEIWSETSHENRTSARSVNENMAILHRAGQNG